MTTAIEPPEAVLASPANADTKAEGPVHLPESQDQQDLREPELPFSKARCIALVATVTGASLLNTITLGSVVIILPTIGRELDIPTSRLQWVVSSYSLAFGCFLLVWGRIADIYGKRLIFIAGSLWVTVMSVVNPFMPNEVTFDLIRGLHGLGAAANVPTAIGILGVVFPPGKAKNYAFSVYSVGAPMGGVFGNILSGIVAEYSTWKWVFFATAFMGGAITIAGVFLIPTVPAPSALAKASNRAKAASVDWLGGLLVTVALLALTFALTEGNIVGWHTPWIPALIVASLLLLCVFVVWQWYLETKTTRKPLMKVSMFQNRRFSAVMVIMAVFFASYNNFVIFATYFFQDYQGLSPLQTMLRFLPTGASGIVTVGIMATLLSRIRTYYLIIYGATAMCLAALLFAVPIPPDTTYFAWAFFAMILSVNGSDTMWPCLTLFTSSALPAEDQALGGALLVACGQVGRSIGLAISTAVQTAVMARARGVSLENVGPVKADAASLQGIRVAGWINFSFGVCALVIVVFMLRSKEVIGKTR